MPRSVHGLSLIEEIGFRFEGIEVITYGSDVGILEKRSREEMVFD